MHTAHDRRGRRRLVPLLAAASMLIAGALSTVSAAPAQAAACQAVKYTAVSSWNGGYQANVSITAGTESVNGWTMTFDLPQGVTIGSAWNTTATQSGTTVTAKDVGWNGSIPAGTTREVFGAVLSGSSATLPTSFTLNGVLCGGGSTTPSATPTATPTVTPTATPTPTVTPTTPAGSGCTGGAFCDGFESQTGSTPGGGWTVGAENCTGTGTATVDGAVAHSGSKSIRVNGGGGYCNHLFVGRSIPAGTTWFRVYMRHSTAQPQTHTTFIAMNDAADAGKDLRIGGQNSALQWNRESDDATLPEQSPNGVALSKPLPTGSWQCLEYQVEGGKLATYLNGSLVTGLVADGVPTQDVDRQWGSRAGWSPSLTDLRLGWESYGGDSDTVWYDDVAYGSQRIGC